MSVGKFLTGTTLAAPAIGGGGYITYRELTKEVSEDSNTPTAVPTQEVTVPAGDQQAQPQDGSGPKELQTSTGGNPSKDVVATEAPPAGGDSQPNGVGDTESEVRGGATGPQESAGGAGN